MKRIWLLIAIMVLAIGCSQNTVVKNDGGSEAASSTTTTESNTDTEKFADDVQDAVGKVADEVAPDPRDEDADAENEEADPATILAGLREKAASPAEYLAFAEENSGNASGFEALRVLSQNPDLEDEPKAKLLELMKNDYLMNEESQDSQALTAAMMLMGMGDPDHRAEVTDAMIERFVEGKEELDRTASRVMGLVMQQGSDEAKQKITDQLLENFADDDAMLGFVQQLTRGIPSGSTVSFLKTLIDRTTKDNVKGTAMMSLAQLYASIPDSKSYVTDERFKKAFPKETIEFITNFDEDEYAGEIEMLLTKVKEDFGDVKMQRGTLGEMAESELFVIQNLSVGKTAPDIVGEDLDGEEFKLSDYRGKVVMLDFWGDW